MEVEASPASAFNMDLVVGLFTAPLVPDFNYIYNVSVLETYVLLFSRVYLFLPRHRS
jgi:hypothetical protein